MMSRFQQFLDEYQSANTRNAYRYALGQFFTSVYGAGEVADQVEQYFMDKRDYKGDVKAFLTSLNGRPPKSVTMMLAAVKSFLVEQDVELPQKFWRRLRKKIRGSRARTVDRVPSNAELRRLLLHMNIQGKALFLVLASSGMRIGEALSVHLDDVDLDADPARIVLRGDHTKTGNSRACFISSEAVEAVAEWLRNRDQYIATALRKSSRYRKDGADPRLFPFTRGVAHVIWTNALRDAGLDATGRVRRRRSQP